MTFYAEQSDVTMKELIMNNKLIKVFKLVSGKKFRLLKSTVFIILGLTAFGGAQAIPIPLSGNGTATIDGVISPLEWGSAGFFDFLVNTPGSGTADGRFYIMNDTDNMYFALRFERSIADAGNSFSIEFDNDNSGNISEGDDGIILNPNPSVGFSDLFRSSGYSCPSGALCSFRDTNIGGTVDGTGAFSNDGTYTMYELSHPLDSGDMFDYSLTAGDMLGFSLFIRTIEAGVPYPDGFGDTSINFGFAEFSVTSVPEPASIALVCFGLAGMGYQRRRKQKGNA